MAILKHRSSKNPNYNDVLDYLIYEHNEATNTPILDENGDLIPRKEYYLDGINCEPDSFAVECRELNRRWGKNQNPDDVKTHQYILSFDPKDVEERGLTGEKVQSLAMEFAERNFPGHQILVCTHTDGHNESGNIHAHIVLNSLRKYDVPEDHECYVERPSDLKAGYKHHQTREMLEYLKADVMEMCRRESLCQVDLLNRTGLKRNDREYMARRNGQRKMDREQPGTQFQTQKDYLRNAIDTCAGKAKDREEFERMLLEEYGIKVTESRGRISYLHPERKQNISGRALGVDYELGNLNSRFAENRSGAGENSWDENAGTDKYHQPHTYDRHHDYTKDPITVLYIRSGIRLVNDMQIHTKAMLEARMMLAGIKRDAKGENEKSELQALTDRISADRAGYQEVYDSLSARLKMTDMEMDNALGAKVRNYEEINRLKNEKNELFCQVRSAQSELRHCGSLMSQISMQAKLGYDRTVQIIDRTNEIANLKMIAKTICWVQDHGYDTREKLQDVLSGVAVSRQKAQEAYNAAADAVKEAGREIGCMGKYLSNKAVYKEFLTSKNKGKFRKQHEKEINAYESAVKVLKEMHPDGKFDTMKDVKLRRADLQAEKDRKYQELKYYKDQEKDLNVICTNVDEILNSLEARNPEREEERERTMETREERRPWYEL